MSTNLFNLTAARSPEQARDVMSVYRQTRDALHKARRRKGTNVDAVIKAEEKRLVSRVSVVFKRAAKKRAAIVRRRLTKASSALIMQIIEDLDADGVSVEVVAELTSTMKRVYRDAHASAVKAVDIEDSGYMLQHADELALEYAEVRAAELVSGISNTTRDDLRALIEESVGEGTSVGDVADQIEEAFVFSPARAEMIARTELAEAHVAGNIQGWRDSGVVENKRWIVGAGCCGDCDDMDGAEVALDDMFATPDGDIDGPPLHPNCRCDVEPVVVAQGSEED